MMRFDNEDEGVKLELPLGIARYMRCLTTMSKGNETGGVLIGTYSCDLSLAIVARATAHPSDSRAGATWFERGTAGMDKLLEDAWAHGLHYLGEWHYHPGGAPFASSNDEMPVLIILGDQADAKIAAYAQKGGRFVALPTISEGAESRVFRARTKLIQRGPALTVQSVNLK
jgi:hypothetical protein